MLPSYVAGSVAADLSGHFSTGLNIRPQGELWENATVYQFGAEDRTVLNGKWKLSKRLRQEKAQGKTTKKDFLRIC